MNFRFPLATKAVPDSGQLRRYTGVGVLAVAAHLGVLALSVEFFGVPPGWGSAAGAVVGAQVAFFGNRRYTFGHLGPMWSAWWRFQITALAGGALGACLVGVTTARGLHWLPAQVIATGLVLLVTFTVNLRWTFGRRRQ
ncbi:MAG: GtrA family protein [Betaproteobacteria bacterium]